MMTWCCDTSHGGTALKSTHISNVLPKLARCAKWQKLINTSESWKTKITTVETDLKAGRLPSTWDSDLQVLLVWWSSDYSVLDSSTLRERWSLLVDICLWETTTFFDSYENILESTKRFLENVTFFFSVTFRTRRCDYHYFQHLRSPPTERNIDHRTRLY